MPIPSITDGLTRVLLSYTALDGTVFIGMTRPILGSAALKNLGDFLQRSLNLSDVPDKPTARTNLGLGTAATHDVGPHMTRGPGLPNQVVLFRHLGDAAYKDVSEIIALVPPVKDTFISLNDTPNGYAGTATAGALLFSKNDQIAYTQGTGVATWDGKQLGVNNGSIGAAGGDGLFVGYFGTGGLNFQTAIESSGPGAGASGKFFIRCANSVPAPGAGGDLAFSADMLGNLAAVNTTIAAADFAEWMEGAGDLGTGYPVIVGADGLVRIATEGDEPSAIIGVTRPRNTRGAVIGNADMGYWSKKYLTDDFGEPIMVPGTQQQLVNGNPNITQTVEVETWALNPDFDASLPYTPRADRPEWNLIGLLGQIPVRKGHPTHPSWRKLRPISAQADLWLVIR